MGMKKWLQTFLMMCNMASDQYYKLGLAIVGLAFLGIFQMKYVRFKKQSAVEPLLENEQRISDMTPKTCDSRQKLVHELGVLRSHAARRWVLQLLQHSRNCEAIVALEELKLIAVELVHVHADGRQSGS